MGLPRAARPIHAILCGLALTTASTPAAAARVHAPATTDAARAATTEPPADASPPSEGAPDGSPTASEPAPTPVSGEEPTPEAEPTPEPDPPSDTASAPAPASKPAPAPAPTPTPAPKAAPADDLPQPLSPMQTAGWWTLFGGVAVGTLAGVMAGLAERQEDRALRLSVRFELDTGEQTRFEDVRAEYESTLRKGRAQANAGVALAVIGLGATVAGIVVLAVAGARQRKRPSTARLRIDGGTMAVRF